MPKKTNDFSPAEYYEKHKQEISDRKRSRYLNDPVYRETIRNNAAKRYANSRGVNSIERAGNGLYKINGINYYSVSYLAHRVGVSSQLINYYLVNGVLPEPRKLPNYYRRLFSVELMEASATAIMMYQTKKIATVSDIIGTIKEILGDKYKELTHNVSYRRK